MYQSSACPWKRPELAEPNTGDSDSLSVGWRIWNQPKKGSSRHHGNERRTAPRNSFFLFPFLLLFIFDLFVCFTVLADHGASKHHPKGPTDGLGTSQQECDYASSARDVDQDDPVHDLSSQPNSSHGAVRGLALVSLSTGASPNAAPE
jgi:hypothetical protein